jgi:uroporphyrin-III C-methyltransferase
VLGLDDALAAYCGYGPVQLRRAQPLLANSFRQTKPKVYLVGAGPGDPDLLTVKAERILRFAGVVLHDALVSSEVLALVSPEARIVNVGKRCGQKNITQAEINELLIQYATYGHIVVRLKSGDPLIFGRAGEELEALTRAGIDFEIVPGITAALSAAAAMKVPLTDRRSTDRVLFLSAHHAPDNEDSEWRKIVHKRTTLIIYMPGKCVGIIDKLRRAGFGGTTPCAIISRVSCREEQCYQTTLASLEYAPHLPPPSVLIVGEILSTATNRRIRSLSIQSGLRDEASTISEFA